ncbi:unnamed protein product, partial [Lymnaea stagnalis]
DFNSVDDAINDLEKAVSLDNKYALAYSYLGLAKLYKDSVSGLTEMNRAIELQPKSAVSYFNRASFYQSQRELKKAIADYTQAILLHGTKPAYYNARGMAHFRSGDGVAAVQDFSTAVAQNPTFARGYFNRAYTYKKFPAAAADPYIERGLMRSTSTGINIDGLDAETIAELNLALADFQQAIKLNPKSAEAFNGRASCYDQLGKKDLALADYTKAIELDPNLATAYMGRMAIYCEMGKKELSFA